MLQCVKQVGSTWQLMKSADTIKHRMCQKWRWGDGTFRSVSGHFHTYYSIVFSSSTFFKKTSSNFAYSCKFLTSKKVYASKQQFSQIFSDTFEWRPYKVKENHLTVSFSDAIIYSWHFYCFHFDQLTLELILILQLTVQLLSDVTYQLIFHLLMVHIL